MKRRITLSIALALSVVLVSLMSSASTAKAQPPQRFVADTGVVTLGPNQKLRLSVGGQSGNNTITVRFRRLGYSQMCQGPICKLTVASQTTSDPITLAPNEAGFFDIFTEISLDSVRGIVVSNSRNVRVNAMIIDTTTGEVVAFFDIFVE